MQRYKPATEPTIDVIAERAAIVRSQWSPETLAARSKHFAPASGKTYYVTSSSTDDAGWTPPVVAAPLGWCD